MRKREVIIGEKFNRWEVITDLGYLQIGNSGKYRHVWVKCECGTERQIPYNRITTGYSKSCGCFNLEKIKERNITHGLSDTRIYKIWKGMKKRCYNTKSANYKNYGERGIIVCDEWLSDFMLFYNWSMCNNYKDSLSIDRIDNDGNYEPNNCRWATRTEQNTNTRRNRKFKAISPEGKEYVAESQHYFAIEHGLDRRYISSCLVGKQKTYKKWRFYYLD